MLVVLTATLANWSKVTSFEGILHSGMRNVLEGTGRFSLRWLITVPNDRVGRKGLAPPCLLDFALRADRTLPSPVPDGEASTLQPGWTGCTTVGQPR